MENLPAREWTARMQSRALVKLDESRTCFAELPDVMVHAKLGGLDGKE